MMLDSSTRRHQAKPATIKPTRKAIALEKAGLRVEPKKTSDFPLPEELIQRFRSDPRFKGAFER